MISARVATCTLVCLLMLGSGGCRKNEGQSAAPPGARAEVAPELLKNDLVSLPGAVYRSQAASPIHWQQWTQTTFERAKAANRLLFCVVALPQQPGFQSVLSALDGDSDLVSSINDSYVPVLVDGDASRELGLLTADLCAEIKRPLQLPLFIWITPEGNPVAWIPVAASNSNSVSELFNQSHSMVNRMWTDDSGYVLTNSGKDNINRRMRIGQRKNATVMSQQPAADLLRCIRQMCSLYDTYSRNFDEAGGLFPAGALDLLSTAAVHPGLSDEVRTRCMETTRELLIDLLPSPMFDPIEGGVFSSRRGNSWALPGFSTDCVSQTRAVVALIHAYRATGDLRALDKALASISYAEKSFTTTEGLFAVGLVPEVDISRWLWTVEEIEKELPAEEAAWWIKATGMKGLGNLPSEVDPRREFFRANSIGIGKSIPELAKEFSLPPEEFSTRFETSRKKLLKVRNARHGEVMRDDASHAGASFRMVSAYAAAFGVTGDERFKEKAIALLAKSREVFSDGAKLRNFSKPAPQSLGEGRAFLYGLALQAALDVSVITSDEKWLLWSDDLATVAAELFTGSEFLKECPDDARIIDLPVTDLVMLFDDSTAGLISFAESRLAARGRPLVQSFSALAIPLPVYAMDRPILHTDLLQATLAREFPVKVVIGRDLPADLKKSVEMLPLRMIQRVVAKPADDVPAGSVLVLDPTGRKQMVTSPAALREALLPTAIN
jgi:uncharacterized protein YyaL (SSP411 family)